VLQQRVSSSRHHHSRHRHSSHHYSSHYEVLTSALPSLSSSKMTSIQGSAQRGCRQHVQACQPTVDMDAGGTGRSSTSEARGIHTVIYSYVLPGLFLAHTATVAVVTANAGRTMLQHHVGTCTREPLQRRNCSQCKLASN
jgi:hypothetical protein